MQGLRASGGRILEKEDVDGGRWKAGDVEEEGRTKMRTPTANDDNDSHVPPDIKEGRIFIYFRKIIFPHTDAIYTSLYVKGCYFGKLCMNSGLVSAVLASAVLAKFIFPRTLRMAYQRGSVEGYAYLCSYPEIPIHCTEVQVRKVRELK